MRYDHSPQLSVSYPTTSSRRGWEEQANQRIAPASGNLDERTIVFKRNEAITAAYAEMYLRNPQVYKWAGMAALTSATVGRALVMKRFHARARGRGARVEKLFSNLTIIVRERDAAAAEGAE